MRNIEVTLEQRMSFEFVATDEEVKALEMGIMPDRFQEKFDKANWGVDSWRDYAVYDYDNEKQIVDWD